MILTRQGKTGSLDLEGGLALARHMENAPCTAGDGEEEVPDADTWPWGDEILGFCGGFHLIASILSMK